ncbi:peptidylprolyl isomerase [Sideroxydans lithotrophicus]|uniref:peptidylprolyl isomerase n=1 Tax=Sideroxydans lithotrophicus (strain ES-1) TaxID=580332 RepID=D5CTR5_SIDLE|nr:peptidylprolyl isomerase [Sideroxydans lithotrophicus]ADE12227.1 PpiC-type peptidyl-prolyl cis-trans isomerase [Sideroxydans lithotrophicus ES-1]
MLKFSRFALLSALLAIAAVAQAADEKAAAIVNGVSIPQARVDIRIKVAAQQGQPDSPEFRKVIRDDLINLEVISQAAVKNGLDKQPDVAQQLELARQSVLAGAFVQDYAKSHPIGDDVLQKEYEALKARVGNKEYKLSHILVGTEDEAKKIAGQLKKGAKFAKIAKAQSKDPGSKNNGGDLGWAVPSNFVQPFAEAVAKLKKGEVSAPVQTQYGWHIIKLEDTRELKVPTFEEMKPNLEKRLQQQAIQKEIEDMRSKAKVE